MSTINVKRNVQFEPDLFKKAEHREWLDAVGKQLETKGVSIKLGVGANAKTVKNAAELQAAMKELKSQSSTGAVGGKVPYKGKDISGTSMASPLSASVAALMIKNNPRITVDQIEAILKQTAMPVKGGLNEIDVVHAIALAKARAK